MPAYLSELRQLQVLSIDRQWHHLLYPKLTLPIIQSLSQHLVTLELMFSGATSLLFPNADFDASQPPSSAPASLNYEITSPWTLKSAFPVLEVLQLSDDSKTIQWTPAMLSQLPELLSEICVYQSDQDTMVALMASLPPSIRDLTVLHCPFALADFLPLVAGKSLTCLECPGIKPLLSSHEHIALLPRTLTTITCGNLVSPYLEQKAADALPPALENIFELKCKIGHPLRFDHLPHLSIMKSEDEEGGSLLDRLPFTSDSIKQLPRTLETLEIAGDIAEVKVSDWPPNLAQLSIVPLLVFPFDCLPPGLLRLSFHHPVFAIPWSSIALLPRTLLILRIFCLPLDVTENIDFPPHLISLSLNRWRNDQWVAIEPTKDPKKHSKRRYEPPAIDTCDNVELEAATAKRHPKLTSCPPLQCIPRSVRELYITCPIPASQLVHLPPQLTDLSTVDMFEDADFKRYDPRHLSTMAKLYKLGELQRFVSPASHISLPASIASLLPRSLTNITTWGGCLWRDCDWHRLPPNLETIESLFSDLPISAESFKDVHLPRLKELKLNLTGLTDNLVKLMPQSLTHLNLPDWPQNSLDLLTISCAPDWPPNLDPNRGPPDARLAIEALQELRAEAIASSSTSRLSELFPGHTALHYDMYT